MKQTNLFILTIFFFCRFANAQSSSISLEECLRMTAENYPLTAQSGVIEQITDEAIHKVNAAWQPQVALNAQATYQSEVVTLPIDNPLIDIPELSKDQYKATLDVSQLIYDGGISNQQRTLQNLNSEVEKQKIVVELYKVKDKVSQIYFSVLLGKENLLLLENVKDDLGTKRTRLENGLKNGVVSQNSIDILNAEILKTDQKIIEVQSSITAAARMLSKLTGITVNENMEFVSPSFNYDPVDTTNHRPELDLFVLQTKYALQQSDFMSATTLPKLSLFVQGGYGRPGLNYLVDEFDFFAIGGIKLNYPLWQGNSKKYDAAIYQLNTETILHQQQVFELNSDVQSAQQKSDIDKYNNLIELDNQIVALREKTKTAAAVQLENGVITSTDYVNEVNATLQAQQNLSIHQIQLLTAKANYLITTGKL